MAEQREHLTDGSPCWCNPRIVKVEAQTKRKVRKGVPTEAIICVGRNPDLAYIESSLDCTILGD